jgi:hypothetical protein
LDSILASSQRSKEFCNTIGGEADQICSRRAFPGVTDAVDKVADDLGEALCLNI